MIVVPARKTFAFSKSERLFVIATERFGRLRRDTYALRDIADVLVDESKGDDGSTYRVAITLADRRRVPFTSYYSSGIAKKRVIVDIVRHFLALDPDPRLGSNAPTVETEREARNGRIVLIIMGAVCCMFLFFGVSMLRKEHHSFTAYLPVTATVLSTRVEEHHDSDGSTYEPVVVYRYRVNDREYTAKRVTPLNESRSGRWAYRVTARYQVGNDYPAFYDPARPGDAYLLRSRSIVAWAFVAIPIVGLTFILNGIKGSRETQRISAAYRSR